MFSSVSYHGIKKIYQEGLYGDLGSTELVSSCKVQLPIIQYAKDMFSSLISPEGVDISAICKRYVQEEGHV